MTVNEVSLQSYFNKNFFIAMAFAAHACTRIYAYDKKFD